MKVLLTGSQGLIGSHLLERLVEDGHQVTPLVRRQNADGELRWDPERGAVDIKLWEGYDAVVHLGGVSIGDKRWTNREKARIWDSRVISTETLALTLAKLEWKPKVFVSASAVGYYGDTGDEEIVETAPRGEGFLAQLCEEWERSTIPAKEAGIRVVNIRSGIVFAEDGGMLKKQLPLFKLAIAGRLGSGQQWMSWIDIDDEVNAIIHAINTSSLSGPVNCVSPDPITNQEFTNLFATVLHRPAFIPAPAWMLELALGKQLSREMLLVGQRCFPEKLLESGFTFQYPDPAVSLVKLFSPDDLHIFTDEDEEETELGSANAPKVIELDNSSAKRRRDEGRELGDGS